MGPSGLRGDSLIAVRWLGTGKGAGGATRLPSSRFVLTSGAESTATSAAIIFPPSPARAERCISVSVATYILTLFRTVNNNPFVATFLSVGGVMASDVMDSEEGPARHLLSYESIKMMAESVGVSGIGEDVATTMAEDLEYRLKEIVQDGLKFMRHSKRRRMKCSDLDCAMRAKNVEPLYGLESAEFSPFKHTTGGSKEYFYTEDKELELNDLISAPLPALPVDATLRAHWLAVEGVQPAIPENPAPSTLEDQKKRALGSGGAQPTNTPLHMKDVRFDKKNKKTSKEEASAGTEWSKLKPLQAHALSLEQQLYYKEISDACVGISDSKRTEALASLSSDPGLYQLLPQFSTFITEGIRVNMSQRKLPMLKFLLKMIKALFDNPNLSLERCLHELIPAIVSCMINRQVCARPEAEDHWYLRDQAAKTLAEICKKYSNSANCLQSRVTRILLQALNNTTQGLAVHYGALAGLIELGQDSVTSLVLPRLKKESQCLDAAPPSRSQENQAATKITQLLQRCVAPVILSTQPSLDTLQAFQEQYGSLGLPLFNQVKTLKQTRAAGVPPQGVAARLLSPTLKSPTVTQVGGAKSKPAPLSLGSPQVSAIKISGKTTPRAQSPISALSSPTLAAALRFVSSGSQSGSLMAPSPNSTPISVSLLSAVINNPAIVSQLSSALSQTTNTTASSGSPQDGKTPTTST